MAEEALAPKELAEKSVEQAIALSFQERATKPDVAGGVGLLYWLVNTGEIIAPWWSKKRDSDLRGFWKGSDHLSGAIYTLTAKLSSVPVRVEARDPTVKSHVKLAEEYQRILIEQTEYGKGWVVAYTKWLLDLFCLAGRTKVHLGGERRGQTKSIAQIVADRDEGPVISVDSFGYLVEKRITKWYMTPLWDRRWWWISLAKASFHAGKRRGGIFLTEEHRVFTDHGWLMARDVKPGMKMMTGDPVPSSDQAEVIVGGLLGDMSIGMVRKRAMLRFTHSTKQRDWFDFKIENLEGFQWTGLNEHSGKTNIRDRTFESAYVGINSRASLGLVDWYDRWYGKDGKKVVCREDVLEHFSPRMLAVWYCDDGSLGKNKTRAGNPTSSDGTLYTNGFDQEDVEWLVQLLCDKGIDCSLYLIKNQETEKSYPVIHISCEGMRQLTEYIGAYVPHSMRYKLPNNAPSFDPSLWNLMPAESFFDEVVISKQRDYKSGRGVAKTAYCLGIEDTECFVAANTLVHNCQDNGAFMEVIGAGDPTGPIRGKPVGLAHLDSFRCQRTSDPKYPVVYEDTDGKRYKLHYTRVVEYAQLASPAAEMRGVGFCLCSRCVNIAQNLIDIGRYKQEKLGSRPLRAMLVGRGIGQGVTQAALAQASVMMDSKGLSRFAQIPVIEQVPTDGGYDLVPLASLPDGFDEKQATELGMFTIALAAAVPPRWLWPATAAGATKADAQFQHYAGLGGGAGQTLRATSTILGGSERGHTHSTGRFLPPQLRMVFDYQDDEQDRMQGEIKEQRSETRDRDLNNGVITVRVARQQAVKAGDLSETEFEELELGDGRLPDGTDVLVLFDSDDARIRNLLDLGVPAPLDVAGNDPDAMRPLIREAQHKVDIEIMRTSGQDYGASRQARAALDQLDLQYEEVQTAQRAEQRTPTLQDVEDEEEEPEAADEQEQEREPEREE